MAGLVKSLLRRKFSEFLNWCAGDGSYIGLYRWILFHHGFWPSLEATYGQRYSTFRWFRFGLPRLTILGWLYMILISYPMTIYTSFGVSQSALLDAVVFMFAAAVLCTAGICLVYRGEHFAAVIDDYEAMKECASTLPEHPRHIVDRGRKLCDLQFYLVLLALAGGSLVLFVPLPYLINSRIIHISAWYPVDVVQRPLYEMLLAIWVTHLWVDMGYILPSMVMLNTLLVEAKTHLQLLNHNLATICQDDRRVVLKNSAPNSTTNPDSSHLPSGRSDANMARDLRSCVGHHQAIIRCVSTIENCYNPLITVFLCSILIPLGLAIVALPHIGGFDVSTLAQLLLAVCLCSCASITFDMSNRITEQSELVRDSVFNSDWLTASESFKRSMRIIMARSNKPVVIKAAGFVRISRQSYRELFYLAYKFYMFMRDVQNVSEE